MTTKNVPNEGDLFTLDHVTQLLMKHVCGRQSGRKLPSGGAIEQLRAMLNIMPTSLQGIDEYRPAHRRRIALNEAAILIEEQIDHAISVHTRALERSDLPPYFRQRLILELTMLESLRATLVLMRRDSWLLEVPSEFGKRKTWHYAAQWIADTLVLALRSSNPGLQLGYANDGPVARFVAAAIGHILGHNVNVTSVAQVLKRQARDTGDKSVA